MRSVMRAWISMRGACPAFLLTFMNLHPGGRADRGPRHGVRWGGAGWRAAHPEGPQRSGGRQRRCADCLAPPGPRGGRGCDRLPERRRRRRAPSYAVEKRGVQRADRPLLWDRPRESFAGFPRSVYVPGRETGRHAAHDNELHLGRHRCNLSQPAMVGLAGRRRCCLVRDEIADRRDASVSRASGVGRKLIQAVRGGSRFPHRHDHVASWRALSR